MPCKEGVDAAGGDGSFCGGAGGASGPGGAFANGPPSGPRGSSAASSFVACPPYCFLRGPRPAGERGAAETLGAEIADDLESSCDAASCQHLDVLSMCVAVPDSFS